MPTRVHATVEPLTSRVEAQTRDGERIAIGADPPDGDGSGAAPKEVLLAALAGCTGMDVASILRKKRQQAAAYEIVLSAESASEHPKVFTSIEVEHRVHGGVEPEALRRSIELSATRYCPVSAMLSAGVTIEHRYRLTRPGEPEMVELVAVTGPS